jgi:hypothetical protein
MHRNLAGAYREKQESVQRAPRRHGMHGLPCYYFASTSGGFGDVSLPHRIRGFAQIEKAY